MSQPILSICIVTLYKRAGLLAVLLRKLSDQMAPFPGQVELIVVDDDGQLPTGTKRNKAYLQASGKYVASVDDDDMPADYYVEEILKAAEQDPDAIAINGTISTDGRNMETWDISMHNPYATLSKPHGKKHYVRYHNHLSPIRRIIALQFPFPDVYKREDYEFATAIHKARAIRTEVKIEKPMYHYKYVSNK